MADFKTHVTTSTLFGCGYAFAGVSQGAPIDSSLVAGGLCGVSGMLPDLDSDTGIPLRETMSFAAAIVPMLLLDRFEQFGLSREQIVLAAGFMYFLVRFGFAKLLAMYTVHRGMFHSIPAALTFTGVAFLLCGTNDLTLRYFKAGGVFLGVMSHLLLDEIYSIQWSRARVKKSFGTAMKLWGPDFWGNVSVYGKLAIVVLLILGEPQIVDRFGIEPPVALQRLPFLDRAPANADQKSILPADGIALDAQRTAPSSGRPQGLQPMQSWPPTRPSNGTAQRPSIGRTE